METITVIQVSAAAGPTTVIREAAAIPACLPAAAITIAGPAAATAPIRQAFVTDITRATTMVTGTAAMPAPTMALCL